MAARGGRTVQYQCESLVVKAPTGPSVDIAALLRCCIRACSHRKLGWRKAFLGLFAWLFTLSDGYEGVELCSAYFLPGPRLQAPREHASGVSHRRESTNYPAIYSKDPDPSQHGTALCCLRPTSHAMGQILQRAHDAIEPT